MVVMTGRLKFSLVLASGSPRRRQLLAEAGYEFDVVPPRVHEPDMAVSRGLGAAAWAEALAYFKARAGAEVRPGAIVIGADTVVARENAVLGKPRDEADARRMLGQFFAGCNEVITGLCILAPCEQARVVTHVSSTLVMRAMEPEELEAYLSGGAWRDKAGAYAFQEGGDKFVRSVAGSVSNVVGLPLERLGEILQEFQA